MKKIKTIILAAACFLAAAMASAQSPTSLQWEWNATGAQTVYVPSGDSLDYSVNASACTHFRVVDNHASYNISVSPVNANTSESDLVQTLYVTCDGFSTVGITLRHKACPYSVSASPSALSWDWNGTGGKSVTVTAGYAWSASLSGNDASAFSLSASSGGTGTSTVTVTPAGENLGSAQRSAVLTFTCGTKTSTVTLTQGTDPLISGLSSSANYIQKVTFINASGTSYTRDVTYYDGLGYEEQALQVAGSPGGKTLATQTVWDAMHRPDTIVYLPYVRSDASASQLSRSSALSAQAAWYANNTNGYSDSRPYAVKSYEGSQYGRLKYTQREGDAWNAGAGHGTSISYGLNRNMQGETSVLRFAWHPADALHAAPYVTSSGDWPDSTLARTRTTDEAGAVSDTYSTAKGLTVCTRSWTGTNDAGTSGTMSETYYVYDYRDSLVLVVQPEGAAALRALTPSNRTITIKDDASNANNTIYREYCFGYVYDGWGNCITEHVPGGGTTERVFDARDRLVLETNDLMTEYAAGDYYRQSPRYIRTEYDVFDRVVARRMVMSDCTISQLRQLYSQGTSLPSFYSSYITPIFPLYAAEYFPFSDTIPNVLTGFTAEYGVVASTDVETANIKGLLKSETFYPAANADGTPPDTASGGNISRTRRYYYDYRGRTLQVKEADSDGWAACYSTKYDFVGNILKTKETHDDPYTSSSYLLTSYSYDSRGRLKSISREQDGMPLSGVTYSYDALGRLAGKNFGNSQDGAYGTQGFVYDIHGWTTAISAGYYGSPLFSEALRYASVQKPGSTERFDGNIAETAFTSNDGTSPSTTDTYGYVYDGLKRLIDAAHYTGTATTPDNAITERGISYDRNGNITALTRYDESGTGTQLSFSHAGNRLAGGNYGYDAMGNMSADSLKGLQFSYNLANLPCKVEGMAGSANAGLTLSYGYLSDGTKTSADTNQGERLRYRGSFVYEKKDGEERISSIAWDEGRISFHYLDAEADSLAVDSLAVVDSLVVEEAGICDEWHVRDHLGNVRAVAGIGDYITGVRELNGYLPFGTRVPGSVQYETNRHRWGGKEEQRFGTADLSLSDFGARYYDPVTCRWTTRDPLAGKYHSWSPYNYCAGNPLNLVDQNGTDFHKKIIGNTIIISASYSANIESYKSASQAVSFWNNRQNDKVVLNGKEYKIKYDLTVKLDRFGDGAKQADNVYSVVPDNNLGKNTAGKTDNKSAISVKQSMSETNAKGENSSTGAHEIGHTLGMGHDETGIMTPSQNDPGRSSDVTKKNLQEMVSSQVGKNSKLNLFERLFNKVYSILN